MLLKFSGNLRFRPNQQHRASIGTRSLHGSFNGFTRRIIATYSIKNYSHSHP
jgi:hypothetical protein